MALMDVQAEFYEKVTVTATGNSDIYDAGGAVNLGESGKCKLLTFLASVGGTGPTLAYNLVGADDAAFSSNKITIAAVASHTPVNGYERVAIPNHTRKRFFRLELTVGGTSPTMQITSGIVLDEQTTIPLV